MIHSRMENISGERELTGGYAYTEYPITPMDSKHCKASFYQIPPGKANYPYHYHVGQEETFYIISGKGTIRTPEGLREVHAGDALFFPAGESGAHQLTNTSDSEPLVYLDVDTIADVDVAVYPDSGKIGVWSPKLNGAWRRGDRVHYYEGESIAEE